MNWHRLRLWAAPLMLLSCTVQPYSRWQVKLPEDDRLANRERITLVANTNSKSAHTLAAIARYYAAEEDWKNALATVNQAIKLNPLNSYLHSLKAEYAFYSGDVSMAYAEATTAYKLGSRTLRQSLGLARIAVALAEFEMAGGIIDSLLVIYPDKPEVLYLAARKFAKHDDLAKARACYQKVVALEPQNQENAFHYARFLLARNEPVNARLVLEQAAAQDNPPRYRQLQAEACYLTGQYDSAALLYTRALTGQRADTVVLNKLIKVYQTTGYLDSIISVSRMAAARFPDNKTYLLLAARSLDKRYRYGEALAYYQKLHELDSLDSMVGAEMSYLQRKIAYLQRKQREQKKLADSLNRAVPAINFR